MLNDYSGKSKVIRAALDLAQERGWRELTLAEIGAKANVSLAELRDIFSCKSEILVALQQEVDKAVLLRVGQGSEGQSPKDRLLDVLMTRFEVMAPMRQALRRIYADVSQRPGEAAQLLSSGMLSQYWMLTGAGVSVWGAMGGLKVAGLSAIYGQVFPFWLEDESAGAEQTMAMLDRKLAKGEQMMGSMHDACGKVTKLACRFVPWRKRSGTAAEAPDVTEQEAAQMGHA